MDERVKLYEYRIEGPFGEIWRGAALEGEKILLAPSLPLRNGHQFRVIYWEMRPQPVSAGDGDG